MDNKRSFVLDEEEQALLDSAPEDCLRHAVERGALSPQQVATGLAPHIAAVVRTIAAGERPVTPQLKRAPSAGALPSPWSAREPPTPPRPPVWNLEIARRALVRHPLLTQMLDEQLLSPGDAIEAAQAIDGLLGRYLTGTRYAAP